MRSAANEHFMITETEGRIRHLNFHKTFSPRRVLETTGRIRGFGMYFWMVTAGLTMAAGPLAHLAPHGGRPPAAEVLPVGMEGG